MAFGNVNIGQRKGAAQKKHKHIRIEITDIDNIEEIPYKDFLENFVGLSSLTLHKNGNRIFGHVTLSANVDSTDLEASMYNYKIASIASAYRPKYATNFTFAYYTEDSVPFTPKGVLPINIKNDGGIYIKWMESINGILNIPFDYICVS